jgi:diguanylate cyclase
MLGMISVRRSIDDLDKVASTAEHNERLASQSIAAWQVSLRSVQHRVIPLIPEAGNPVSREWEALCKTIRTGMPEDVLAKTSAEVDRLLERYATGVKTVKEQDLIALRNILSVLAAAADGIRYRSETSCGELHELGASLSRLAEVESAEELRTRLSEEANSLREIVEKMEKDARTAEAGMRDDLLAFQLRLIEAEAAAVTDSLTGLSNRRLLERELDLRIQNGVSFCVILFDVDEFKSVNDRFGHDCGDQVLRSVAHALREQVRPGDVVARWGGDEFFAILDCPLKDALRRSKQISQKLDTRYSVQWGNRTIQVAVKASVGVVEHQRGESAVDLFRRVDQAMYAAKPVPARA